MYLITGGKILSHKKL